MLGLSTAVAYVPLYWPAGCTRSVGNGVLLLLRVSEVHFDASAARRSGAQIPAPLRLAAGRRRRRCGLCHACSGSPFCVGPGSLAPAKRAKHEESQGGGEPLLWHFGRIPEGTLSATPSGLFALLTSAARCTPCCRIARPSSSPSSLCRSPERARTSLSLLFLCSLLSQVPSPRALLADAVSGTAGGPTLGAFAFAFARVSFLRAFSFSSARSSRQSSDPELR